MAAEPVEAVRAEAVTFGDPPPVQRAGGRGRADSLSTASRKRRSDTAEAVTQRHVRRAGALVSSVRAGHHVTGQLPSIHGQHKRVHEIAGEWDHWALKYSALAWGYFHLAFIHTPLSLAIWATATRARVAVTAVLAFLAWKFH